ncbi:molybdopterin molybdotransferase MoeA [Algoriphagus hitonicola]|uniref:Molybdopterin molybdenumtransferase n=1 Tax=Algoriphagus hitonicola TaxID=435880 RepID=A0A1I2VQR9_9BACT|nr:molybdopterin molybdotransferase MoeA [Algoriphagus hitonicola]SFG91664.1 molybdopterin molybdochelatase [Algoriphagus hitonicola]
MIGVAEAKRILGQLNLPRRKIKIPISQALGYFLAEPVFSKINVPSFDNSAMDGYAFFWQENLNSLRIKGEISAGSTMNLELKNGEAVRIFTGAPMPKGADSVIMQEKVERKGDEIFFDSSEVEKGKHVRYQGSQCRAGDRIAEEGSKITPGMVSLLASVGVEHVEVWEFPGISLIITGNEIKDLGEELNPGQIYNANGPALESWLRQLGIWQVNQIKVRDEKEAVIQGLKEAMESSDLVIFTGGISVGDYDFVKEAVEANQVQELFYKLKQRPGKPLYVGQKAGKLVFGLPGNPGSVLSCFMQYVKPLIRTWQGEPTAWEAYIKVPLADDFEKKIPLTQFLKAEMKEEKAYILQGQESFNLIAFGLADGFVEIPEEIEFVQAGEKVKFFPW